MKKAILLLAIQVALFFLAPLPGAAPAAKESGVAAPVAPIILTASWYGPGFHGRKTANGETFDRNDPTTAAHKTLPFGTRLLVCYDLLCAVVRINDRGPYIEGRELDLSEAAAGRIGMKDRGVARVSVWRVK